MLFKTPLPILLLFIEAFSNIFAFIFPRARLCLLAPENPTKPIVERFPVIQNKYI